MGVGGMTAISLCQKRAESSLGCDESGRLIAIKEWIDRKSASKEVYHKISAHEKRKEYRHFPYKTVDERRENNCNEGEET